MKANLFTKDALSFLFKKSSIYIAFAAMVCVWIGETSCRKKNNGTLTPDLMLVADGFVSPVTVVPVPGAADRLFVVDQVGKVWIIKNGKKLSDPFIDISSKLVTLLAPYDERGLLGLAFHPNYKINGKFYLFYTAPPRPGGPVPGYNWNNLTRISEFKVSSNPDVADANSERVLLEADHPQLNHDGGTIAFGPDGYLYISIGDGGGANDDDTGHVEDWYLVNKGGNAQNVEANLMGKVLRIDVNNGSPYSIPADNPFSGSATARPEIYAFGLRNPYRFSFDIAGSHQLFLSDAGQALYEEINIITKGSNYGWNVREGLICFNTDSNLLTRSTCPSMDPAGNVLKDPILTLSNASNPAGGIATVIVGGFVYRGLMLPSLAGKYVFGTFCQNLQFLPDGKIYFASPASSGAWPYQELALKNYPNNTGQFIKGFGQDLSGEIYVATSGTLGPTGTTGKVFKIVGVQ